jgi:hypothetical protein
VDSLHQRIHQVFQVFTTSLLLVPFGRVDTGITISGEAF